MAYSIFLCLGPASSSPRNRLHSLALLSLILPAPQRFRFLLKERFSETIPVPLRPYLQRELSSANELSAAPCFYEAQCGKSHPPNLPRQHRFDHLNLDLHTNVPRKSHRLL